MEEQVTIKLAQQGDTAALVQLLQKHYSYVLRYLVKITFDPSWAEDLAQETMLKSIHKIKLYNGQSKFSSWLITIATRIHIDHLRRIWEQIIVNERRTLAKKLMRELSFFWMIAIVVLILSFISGEDPMMRNVDGLPLYAVILILLGVIVQGTWLFLDARKRGANAWFWGIWGCLQSPLPLIVYWIVVRRKKKL